MGVSGRRGWEYKRNGIPGGDGTNCYHAEAMSEVKRGQFWSREMRSYPHFLNNTLYAINWKAIEKSEFEISEMVGALGDILRYAGKNPGDESTVEQEFYWLHQYILLQSAKAGKELQVVRDFPAEMKAAIELGIENYVLKPIKIPGLKRVLKKRK